MRRVRVTYSAIRWGGKARRKEGWKMVQSGACLRASMLILLQPAGCGLSDSREEFPDTDLEG